MCTFLDVMVFLLSQTVVCHEGGGNGRGQILRRPANGIVYQFRMLFNESGVECRRLEFRRAQDLQMERLGGFDAVHAHVHERRDARAR